MKTWEIYTAVLGLLFLLSSALYLLRWAAALIHPLPFPPIPPDPGAAVYLLTIGLLMVYPRVRGASGSEAAALIASFMAIVITALQLFTSSTLLLKELTINGASGMVSEELARPEIILGLLSTPLFPIYARRLRCPP